MQAYICPVFLHGEIALEHYGAGARVRDGAALSLPRVCYHAQLVPDKSGISLERQQPLDQRPGGADQNRDMPGYSLVEGLSRLCTSMCKTGELYI